MTLTSFLEQLIATQMRIPSSLSALLLCQPNSLARFVHNPEEVHLLNPIHYPIRHSLDKRSLTTPLLYKYLFRGELGAGHLAEETRDGRKMGETENEVREIERASPKPGKSGTLEFESSMQTVDRPTNLNSNAQPEQEEKLHETKETDGRLVVHQPGLVGMRNSLRQNQENIGFLPWIHSKSSDSVSNFLDGFYETVDKSISVWNDLKDRVPTMNVLAWLNACLEGQGSRRDGQILSQLDGDLYFTDLDLSVENQEAFIENIFQKLQKMDQLRHETLDMIITEEKKLKKTTSMIEKEKQLGTIQEHLLEWHNKVLTMERHYEPIKLRKQDP